MDRNQRVQVNTERLVGSDAISSPATCMASVLGSLATLVTRTVRARWQHDQRLVTVCYFCAVFGIRLFLRTPYADGLHWGLIMTVEDMLSFTSFAIALLYMHDGHGLTLAALAKRLTMLPAATSQAQGASPVASVSRSQPAGAARTRMQPEDMKLFYFAM